MHLIKSPTSILWQSEIADLVKKKKTAFITHKNHKNNFRPKDQKEYYRTNK